MADGGIVTQIPDHIRAQFSDQWGIQVQQLQAKLADTMEVKPDWTAKDYYFDDVEAFEWRDDNGRHAQTNPDEAQLSQVRGTKRYFNVAKIFGRKDAAWLGSIGKPDSEVMTAMKAGWMRKLDERCVVAASEHKWMGPENGLVQVAFPSGNVVPENFVNTGSAANSGLTVPKLFEAARILASNDVDKDYEELYLAISPKQVTDMLLTVQQSSNEAYAAFFKEWLRDRKSKLCGLFNVIESNKLELVTGTMDIRRCPIWTRRAFAMSSDSMTTSIDTRSDLSHSVQIAGYGEKGIVRRYDKRVVHVLCDEVLP